MPKYVFMGATGKIGTVAADYALEIAGPDQKLVFTSHSFPTNPTDKMKEWTKKGAELINADYDDVASLQKAFEGVEAVTFVSTWMFGEERRRQHKTVIDTAKACGVKRIGYTSFAGAGLEKDLPYLSEDHKYTEGVIFDSGLDYNIQRDYLYSDNIPQLFAPSWTYCGHKWLLNSKGVPAAYVARDDCARVAAALLLGKGKHKSVYEVTGPEAISDYKIFEYICRKTGYKGEIQDMTDEELAKWWTDKGLPLSVKGDFSKFPMKLSVPDLVSCGNVVERGLMKDVSGTVEELTGRKPLTEWEVVDRYSDILPRP
ncbi:NAD(P)-binding protein [Mollisia scopiformis]|uniref:NAD(P)-binding protein n=1 Tax=Mollisia scopiformis TaxID=149040 RepID=A0A194WY45_MOLSC|nr:NAD(P)-binding protein [Mollisia scopiformis]KUJ12896.1 NAD(P)-binding protein [Mollisia scopiformis]